MDRGEISMLRRFSRVILTLVWLCALAACDTPFTSTTPPLRTPAPSAPTPLAGTSWTLTQLDLDGQSRLLVPTTPITLQFETNASTYFGSSGCNYYSGTYHVAGNHLELLFGTVTLKGCAGPIMSQEASYLNSLQQVRSFSLSGEVLTLRDEQGYEVLAYRRA
jgi:heat shock protein HslJ